MIRMMLGREPDKTPSAWDLAPNGIAKLAEAAAMTLTNFLRSITGSWSKD